jgi:serine/threonine-protein kinase
VPATIKLEVISGPLQGKVFTFDSHDTFLFGRTKDCHIGLAKDSCVSRHHFILEVNPPDARIRDLGSLNGTIVNEVKHGGRAPGETPQDVAGRQYPCCDLKDGDQITVGKTCIAVRVATPVTCSRCGAEMPGAEGTPAQGADEIVVCANCRNDQATQSVVRVRAGPRRCDQCGKDVASETSAQRQGEYLCESCRDAFVSDLGGIQQLLQAAKHRDEDKPQVEGYVIDLELGRGGMGVVYRGRSERDGKVVAIKVMLAKVAVNERARKMFLREIEVAQQLRHPHVVSPFFHDAIGGAFYCVMDFCNQGSLDGLLRRVGKLSLKTAGPLMIHCLAGLAYAHRNKFVHRDLKPQNILLHKQEGQSKAKLTDFGLAKNFETAGLSGMTATGTAGGTFHFMPREQLTNFKYVHPVSDVWSMAATFYKALTGKCPLDFPPNRDPMEVILRDEAVPIRQREPGIPPPLAEVIDRALLCATDKRYQDAAEMKAAIQRALHAKGT